MPTVNAAQFIYIRPLIYIFAAIVYVALNGKDERPIPNGMRATILARFGVILYFAVLLILGIMLGFGRNATGFGLSVFWGNLWAFGITALLSEYFRFRIIKGSLTEQRDLAAVTITLGFTFAQLDALRGFMRNENFVEFLFVSVIPVLALNAVLSYMSYEGSPASLLLIRGTHSLTPVLLPFMPNLTKEVWAAVTSFLLLVTLVFYHYNMSVQTGRLWRIRDVKPRQKHRKKSKSFIIILFTVITISAMFFLRVFAYFPIVILSDSMSGAIESSSVVIIEKIKTDDVFSEIEIGDIILFRRGNLEVMHRVIGTRENESGERVYITKGDANADADFYPVSAEQIIGIARAYIPYIGYPVVVINSLFNR